LNEKQLNEKFVRSFLDIFVMAILDSQPMCGYEIMATLHKEFGLLLSPGTIYPLLRSLENNELIVVNHIGNKKVYHLSSKGKTNLKNTVMAFSYTSKKMCNFIKKQKKDVVVIPV